ncbi:hypothetical protein THRCLA_00138 [Thraustotheca clavata]|uniref:CFA20 domain-containing protein n=1 Tax=Thraustotheca clavata TaxID=74557 RepID=A0A1W0ACW4_9STRA|nr:hypothetical protein THRCLA_00138 [Thraustotheca clavata]
MFYQGAESVELLAAGGKDPVGKWKTTGKVRREYEKGSKAFLVNMEGTASATKLALPKDSKMGLSMRYLIFQVLIPAGKAVSLEFGVTDANNLRRRLLLSSAFRECAVHQLHAQIPFQSVRRDAWVNLTFNVDALVSQMFPQVMLRSIDSIVLSGTWRIRRIFAMKDAPVSALAAFTPLDENVHYVDIPRAFAVPGCPVEYFTASTLIKPSLAVKSKPLRPESAPVAAGAKKSQINRPSSSISKGLIKQPKAITQEKKVCKPVKKTEEPSAQVKTIFSFASERVPEPSKFLIQKAPTQLLEKKSIFDFASLNIPPLPTKSMKKTSFTEAKTSKFASWEDDTDDLANQTTTPSELIHAKLEPRNLITPKKPDDYIGSKDINPAFEPQIIKPEEELPLATLLVEVKQNIEMDAMATSPLPSPLPSCPTQQIPLLSQIELPELMPKVENQKEQEIYDNNNETQNEPQEVGNADDDKDSECSFDLTEELNAGADGEASFDFDDELEESLPSMVHKEEIVQKQLPLMIPSPKLNVSSLKTINQPEECTTSLDEALLNMDPRLKSLLDWSRPVANTKSNEQVMDLVYDPILQCYHDVATNKYYQFKK